MLICPMLLPIAYELHDRRIMFKNLMIKKIRFELDTSPQISVSL
jgi:hypothetical protein